jgi:hypothetical protein
MNSSTLFIYIARFKMFTLFPVLLTIMVMWGICGIYTLAGGTNQAIRTDTNIDILYRSDWFRVPYPCKMYHLQYDILD